MDSDARGGPETRNDGYRMSDERLDELLEWFLDGEPDEYDPPPPDVVLAYLEGGATAEQRMAVRQAAVRSRTFRRELVELANDLDRLDRLDQTEFQERFDAIEPPRPPTWARSLAERTAAHRRSTEEAADSASSGPRSEPINPFTGKRRVTGRLVEFVEGSLSPLPRWAFSPVIVRSASPRRLSRRPSPSAPLSPATSTTEDGDRRRWETAEEAALGRFMEGARGIGGRLEVVDYGSVLSLQPPPRSGLSSCTLKSMRSRRRRVRLNGTFDLPSDARELRVWVLLLPHLRLFSAEVSEAPTTLLWPLRGVKQASVALSFAVEGGYQAVAPHLELEGRAAPDDPGPEGCKAARLRKARARHEVRRGSA